jgi:ferritin-like metal-binding protein YciE
MKESALKDLYIDELRDIYNAENQLTKALPKMAKASTSDELRAGFEEHLEQTKGHLERLVQIFKELGEKPTGKKCKGMEGLVQEGAEMIEEDELKDEARDAGLISAAQRVEHYEIAAYGCVRTYANLLGEDDAAELLKQTLNEEKETDQKLTKLAEKINVEANDDAEAEEGAESENEVENEERRTRAKPKRRSAHA